MQLDQTKISDLQQKAIALLKTLIETPSISKTEDKTASIIEQALKDEGVQEVQRLKNNVLVTNKYVDPKKPFILLNSHHDTVKPNQGYTKDPFKAIVEGDTLFGLGSNDAGGCLVSLWATFVYLYERKDLPFNLYFLASAEEEVSGTEGIALAKEYLENVAFGLIGEPTQMQLAIAEKGLMVLDCEAKGKAGHAARDEGINALYIAMEDIMWIKNYSFTKESEMLGPIKMTATQIEAGYQHNVVPDSCKFVVDVRTTDAYTNQEVFQIIQDHLKSEVDPRSVRLNPSSIPEEYPIVQAGKAMGLSCYGSPTLSDQSLIDFPSLKCGPGDSARSHTPDEYVKLSEVEHGIQTYIEMLERTFTLPFNPKTEETEL